MSSTNVFYDIRVITKFKILAVGTSFYALCLDNDDHFQNWNLLDNLVENICEEIQGIA